MLYFNLSAKYENIKTQFEKKLLPNFNLEVARVSVDIQHHSFYLPLMLLLKHLLNIYKSPFPHSFLNLQSFKIRFDFPLIPFFCIL